VLRHAWEDQAKTKFVLDQRGRIEAVQDQLVSTAQLDPGVGIMLRTV
jgi:hypothetical protein